MGTSGWDEESLGRGRGSRNGRFDDDERGSGRLYDRSGRGGAASARGYDGSRGRDSGGRGSSGGWERPRDEGRSSSGGRGRGGPNSSPGWDRPGSGGLGNGRRPPREDYDGRGGDRSMRGPRPPREDAWEPANRSRGGMAGGSSGRNRVPRGGPWDDQDAPRRRRPDASDPRGRGAPGRGGPRDVSALRRGLVNMNDEPEEESSFTAGKAILIVLLMFAIGAGAGYGYFKYSQPVVHGDTPASSTPATTPSASPSASPSPSVTPHSLVPSNSGVIVLVGVGADA